MGHNHRDSFDIYYGEYRMNPDWIGWLSSAILLATLLRQIVKQVSGSRHGTKNNGVSRWLFLGQCAASVGRRL
ncbi:hypothetical protein [Lysobacter enzymogenes]|uniref:hypothetical protein n=1 Tax=Lysobacter enzymogenes TaxID=69 RepID=UPI00374A864B